MDGPTKISQGIKNGKMYFHEEELEGFDFMEQKYKKILQTYSQIKNCVIQLTT